MEHKMHPLLIVIHTSWHGDRVKFGIIDIHNKMNVHISTFIEKRSTRKAEIGTWIWNKKLLCETLEKMNYVIIVHS